MKTSAMILKTSVMSLILGAGLTAAGCPQENAGQLEGPGFDEDTGAFLGDDGDYVVGLTYLRVRNAPGPGNRFGELATACGNNLFETEPDGWLGASFYSVGKLEQRTMTVWESEEAMLDWVTSPVHTEAMLEIGDVSSEAKATVLDLTEADLPLSWEEALPIYDDLPWYQHSKMRSE